jgi:hypothetical protein
MSKKDSRPASLLYRAAGQNGYPKDEQETKNVKKAKREQTK